MSSSGSVIFDFSLSIDGAFLTIFNINILFVDLIELSEAIYDLGNNFFALNSVLGVPIVYILK